MHTDRLNGIVLVLISALVFSCAGLFVKSIESDAWSIIFWRGVFAAVFTSAFILHRGCNNRIADGSEAGSLNVAVRREFLFMGRAGIAAAVFGALGTMAFIPAFKLTTVANVSLIYAVSPFIAATIMWIWIRERPGKVVLGASALALLGVLIIVAGSIGALSLAGDSLALFMTLMMSVYLCIYRRFPKTPAAGPAVLMSVLLLPVAGYFGDPLSISMNDLLLTACFGVVFSVASVTLAEGSRRLPASQTALLSALETPLAPVWAWLLLSESPTAATLFGGAVILSAVFGSLYVQSVSQKKPATKQLTQATRACN